MSMKTRQGVKTRRMQQVVVGRRAKWYSQRESALVTRWPTGYTEGDALNTSARSRANETVDKLMRRGAINGNIAARARNLIDAIFTPNTVYATITPDDGGLIFYWKAGSMSIEIDMYAPDGYWWRVKNVAEINERDSGDELPLIELKHCLAHFSKEVDRVNPKWRDSTR